ncbi:hypothetical protein T484DRAFT_1775460 [Baffinella frigidus]|nr:hypothetical protein T484DRAFT_1775460 [Cryptophyta sp. CCMP2293]
MGDDAKSIRLGDDETTVEEELDWRTVTNRLGGDDARSIMLEDEPAVEEGEEAAEEEEAGEHASSTIANRRGGSSSSVRLWWELAEPDGRKGRVGLSSSRLTTPCRGGSVDGITVRRCAVPPGCVCAVSAGERRCSEPALRKCWIFPVEVPWCTSVGAALLCGRAMTVLPPEDTPIEEASVQLGAASAQSEVSSWVPRQAAAVVRQRWREARMGCMDSALVRKPPWRWRVECTSVPSQRRKSLIPGRGGEVSETAERSELWDTDSTLGAENCFWKTPAGRRAGTAPRSCGIDVARCGVLNRAGVCLEALPERPGAASCWTAVRESILEMLRPYLQFLGSCDTESDLARRGIVKGSGEGVLEEDGAGELSGVIANEYGAAGG